MSTSTAGEGRILATTIADPELRTIYQRLQNGLAIERSHHDALSAAVRQDFNRPSATDDELLRQAEAEHAKLIAFRASPAGRVFAAMTEAEGIMHTINIELMHGRVAFDRTSHFANADTLAKNVNAIRDALHTISMQAIALGDLMTAAGAAVDEQEAAFEAART